eukprot:15304326-Alexandrium_andersonii.AAC.1
MGMTLPRTTCENLFKPMGIAAIRLVISAPARNLSERVFAVSVAPRSRWAPRSLKLRQTTKGELTP